MAPPSSPVPPFHLPEILRIVVLVAASSATAHAVSALFGFLSRSLSSETSSSSSSSSSSSRATGSSSSPSATTRSSGASPFPSGFSGPIAAAIKSSGSFGSSAPSVTPIYKLIYTVPPSHLTATKQAIFAVGGGTYDKGKYTNTTFESSGMGVFTPDQSANPAIGTAGGGEEQVEEVRVEVRCEGEICVGKAVRALLRSHPYETVGYEVFKAEDEFMAITKEDALKET